MFEPSMINGLQTNNRFVRSATWEGMAAEDGKVTPKLIELMAELAKGGIGLIISGHAYVHPDGQAVPWQLGVCSYALIPGLREMTGAVHENDGKIVLQLAHAGFFASTKLTGKTPLAASQVAGIAKSPRHEMSISDIKEIVKSFAQAAVRAKSAGFDGVQIHSAHGYLLSQFLSPMLNHREDDYGGDIENRSRALMEVLKHIREAVGGDYPILVKMNCQDFVENGLVVEDAVQVGQMLAENGIDAIELSGGLLTNRKLSPSRAGIKSEDKEAYFQNEAGIFKEKIDIPLILVGGIRSFAVAERLVNEGIADYISMSRPFIREPDLVNRWKNGDLRKAACLSDNQCFGPGMKGVGMYCVTEEREKQKSKNTE
jgi:2,4-dienoyl-CoA reductase-like NADH-dependent reductase (Old Yellow Enzyme family)